MIGKGSGVALKILSVVRPDIWQNIAFLNSMPEGVVAAIFCAILFRLRLCQLLEDIGDDPQF